MRVRWGSWGSRGMGLAIVAPPQIISNRLKWGGSPSLHRDGCGRTDGVIVPTPSPAHSPPLVRFTRGILAVTASATARPLPAVCLLVLLWAVPIRADNWPQWR